MHPKCVCGRGSAPDPVGELGPLRGREEDGKGGERKGKEGRGGKGKGREGEGEGWDGRDMGPRNFENRSTPMPEVCCYTTS